MQKRNPFWQGTVLVVVVIIAAFVSVYQIMNWRGDREWQKHFQGAGSIELRQKVPDELNFAKTPLLENHGYKDRSAPMPANGLNIAQSLIRWSAIGDFRQETFTRLGASVASKEIALSKEDV